jgi:O-glycosyl hydrolase
MQLMTQLLWPFAISQAPITIQWTSSTESVKLKISNVTGRVVDKLDVAADYSLSTAEDVQKIHGFGACFNELGWDALQMLSADDHADTMKKFFHPDEMNLVYNRVPVGANDYADGWYSFDEMPLDQQDLTMSHFNIARDEQRIIPYINEEQKLMDLGTAEQHLFASAWSPPMWMKQNKNFSGCGNPGQPYDPSKPDSKKVSHPPFFPVCPYLILLALRELTP